MNSSKARSGTREYVLDSRDVKEVCCNEGLVGFRNNELFNSTDTGDVAKDFEVVAISVVFSEGYIFECPAATEY